MESAKETAAVQTLIHLDLQKGLAAKEVEKRIAQARRAGDIGARALAFYLVDLSERRVYQDLGGHDLVRLVETKFGIRPQTAREYLSVGRHLEELPGIDDAFCRSELCWSQVRRLVTIATPQTESAWIEWAIGRTVVQLERQVRCREKGQLPTDPAGRRIHGTKFKVSATLDAMQWEIWKSARKKMEAELGRAVTDTEMALEAAELLLKTRSDGTVAGRTPVNDSHFRVVAVQPADGGPPRPVTQDDVADLDDSARAESDADENAGPEVPAEERDRLTPPTLRNRILLRDGCSCRCCEGRENLTVHHKRFRRFGGRTVGANLVTLCEHCHSMVHDGHLVIRGNAEGRLRFLDSEGCEIADLGPLAKAAIEQLVLHVQNDPAKASEDPPPEYPKLADLVGQRRVVENLSKEIEATRLHEDPLPHVLLTGPSGMGKTSVARAIAAEMSAGFDSDFAPFLDTVEKLSERLLALEDGDILFIDEIHRLPSKVAEALYPVMEAGNVTIVGATTEPDRLLRPLVNRFTLRQQLEHYKEPELAFILVAAAKRVGIRLDDDAALALARVSRETPRIALSLLKNVHSEATIARRTCVDKPMVMAVLKRLGIDDRGLRPIDRRYLETLRKLGGCIGLATLAAAMGETEGALRTEVEPYLLRQGLIARTPRGRVLRKAA